MLSTTIQQRNGIVRRPTNSASTQYAERWSDKNSKAADKTDGKPSTTTIQNGIESENNKEDIIPRLPGKRITINVSGRIFETFESTFERFPETLLGNAEKRARSLLELTGNEWFIERNRVAFEGILFYYQSYGKILRPEQVDLDTFLEELDFFEIGQEARNRLLEMEGMAVPMTEENFPDTEEASAAGRAKLWQLLEKSNSSKAAQIIAVWSSCIICLSVILYVLETTSWFKNNSQAYGTLMAIDAFCMACFTLEYALRVISAPQRWLFLKSSFGIIDLMSIAPFYILLVVEGKSLSYFTRVLRLLRVSRVFRIARYHSGLKIFGYTIRSSLNELMLEGFFLIVAVILFSSSAFYFDQDTFISIPDAFWWSIITLTTVGYGDLVPQSLLGKLLGSVCALCGLLLLALLVPVVVTNFTKSYSQYSGQKLSSGF